MISYNSNYFEVVKNMSQVPIELSPLHARTEIFDLLFRPL